MWHILAFHLFQINPGHEMDTLHFKGKWRGSKSTRRFGWKPKNQGHFLAWRAWDKLCHPRSLGGLSLKKAKEINNALIAKLDVWLFRKGTAYVWTSSEQNTKSSKIGFKQTPLEMLFQSGKQLSKLKKSL